MSHGKFVIKNTATGKFIGIDHPSGGYPYEVELTWAKIWTIKEEATRYRNMFLDSALSSKSWTLHKLIVEAEPINWEQNGNQLAKK